MKGLIRKLRRHQSGFTLVELLIVVGIIVALAAAVIPQVARFANKGDTGAQAAELQNVQAAFDTMMANKGITALTAYNLSTTSTATNSFAAQPTGTGTDFLASYLRSNPTTYFYCWDDSGKVTEQFTSATACTL